MGKAHSKSEFTEEQARRKQSCVATVALNAGENIPETSHRLSAIAQQNYRCDTKYRAPLNVEEKATYIFSKAEYQLEDVKISLDSSTSSPEISSGPARLQGNRPVIKLAKAGQIVAKLNHDGLTEKGLAFKDELHGEILRCTPTRRPPAIKMEDTFWSEKRKLIPDYGRMLALDERARQAPEDVCKVAEELVKYLVAVAQNKVEKVRVLMSWVAQHVTFDLKRAASSQSPRSVLKSKRAGVPGFNDVFSFLCSLANIKCDIVTGTCKSGSYFPGTERVQQGQEEFAMKYAHAWSRIKLGDMWYNIDPCWVSGSVENGEYVKHWDEQWFLSEPEHFRLFHLPLVRDEEGLQIDVFKQMEETSHHQYTDVVEWERQVALEPVCAGLGIKPLSHPENVIQTKKNEVLIKFACMEKNLTLITSFRHLDGRDYSQQNALTYTVDGGFHVFVLCPAKGRFKLVIRCLYSLSTGATEEVVCVKIASYMIEASGNIKNPMLPTFTTDGRWGLTDECRRAGIDIDGKQDAMIEAVDGHAKVTLILPTAGWCPVVYRLRDTTHAEDRSQYVYGDKQGRLLTLYVLCPDSNEDYYILEVWFRSTANDNVFDLCSRFLIRALDNAKLYPSTMLPFLSSSKRRNPVFPDNGQGDMWGLTQYAWDIGVRSAEPNLSTLLLPTGSGTLTLTVSKIITVEYMLYSADGEEQKQTSCVYSEIVGDKRVFHIRIRRRGVYRLRIVAGPVGSKTLYDIGNFLLLCRSAWNGLMFPKTMHWGVNSHGMKFGLVLQQSATSTILAPGDALDLDFSTKAATRSVVKLVVEGRTVSSVAVAGQASGFQVTLPLRQYLDTAMAALRVYISDSQDNKYVLAATYLVVKDVDNHARQKSANQSDIRSSHIDEGLGSRSESGSSEITDYTADDITVTASESSTSRHANGASSVKF